MTQSDKKTNTPTKVSLWVMGEVLTLIDQIAKSYGLSRSDFIRLTLREALINRGLLPREIGGPLSTKGEVSL